MFPLSFGDRLDPADPTGLLTVITRDEPGYSECSAPRMTSTPLPMGSASPPEVIEQCFTSAVEHFLEHCLGCVRIASTRMVALSAPISPIAG